jgi:hypothetical protein
VLRSGAEQERATILVPGAADGGVQAVEPGVPGVAASVRARRLDSPPRPSPDASPAERIMLYSTTPTTAATRLASRSAYVSDFGAPPRSNSPQPKPHVIFRNTCRP